MKKIFFLVFLKNIICNILTIENMKLAFNKFIILNSFTYNKHLISFNMNLNIKSANNEDYNSAKLLIYIIDDESLKEKNINIKNPMIDDKYIISAKKDLYTLEEISQLKLSYNLTGKETIIENIKNNFALNGTNFYFLFFTINSDNNNGYLNIDGTLEFPIKTYNSFLNSDQILVIFLFTTGFYFIIIIIWIYYIFSNSKKNNTANPLKLKNKFFEFSITLIIPFIIISKVTNLIFILSYDRNENFIDMIYYISKLFFLIFSYTILLMYFVISLGFCLNNQYSKGEENSVIFMYKKIKQILTFKKSKKSFLFTFFINFILDVIYTHKEFKFHTKGLHTNFYYFNRNLMFTLNFYIFIKLYTKINKKIESMKTIKEIILFYKKVSRSLLIYIIFEFMEVFFFIIKNYISYIDINFNFLSGMLKEIRVYILFYNLVITITKGISKNKEIEMIESNKKECSGYNQIISNNINY